MADDSFEGLGSLVRLSGVIPARARFVGETILTTNLTAITFGMVCGQLGSAFMPFGPLIPYLCGSWAGYTVGLWVTWHSATKLLYQYAREYPVLLCQVLQTEFPNWDMKVPSKEEQKKVPMDQWVRQGGLGRLTLGVLAAQACKGHVDEILQARRQQITEQYSSAASEDDAEE